MKISHICLSAMLIATLYSCSSTVEEDLLSGNDCDTANMSWTNDIIPILDKSCFGCHSTSAARGGIILDTHDAVSDVVNRGRLVGTIRHDSGFSPMPKNAAQLPDCSIDKVISWVADGALNN